MFEVFLLFLVHCVGHMGVKGAVVEETLIVEYCFHFPHILAIYIDLYHKLIFYLPPGRRL